MKKRDVPPVSLLIFDMDGTIMDSIWDMKESVNYCLRQNGLPERSLEEVTHFVGNGSRVLIEKAVPAGTDSDLLEKVFTEYSAYYENHCNDTTRPYEGIPELLKNAREKGLLTAVVSNKPDEAVKKLADCYFPGLFTVAWGPGQGLKKKPAPDMVNAILKQLSLKPEEALYIGDSEVDVETAKNAHLKCLSVTWGFRSEETLRQAGATCFFRSVKALNDYILSL